MISRFLINLGLNLSGKVIKARQDLEKETGDTFDEHYRYTVFKGGFVTITHLPSGTRKEVNL